MASRNFIQAAFLSSNVERSGGLKFIWLCPPLTFLKLEKKIGEKMRELEGLNLDSINLTCLLIMYILKLQFDYVNFVLYSF